MVKESLSRQDIEELIKITFSGSPTTAEIKKIKTLAMSRNIKLGQNKKKFCKKCLTFFKSSNSKIRVKKPLKMISCLNCGFVSRYNLK